jgi:hypothetical protein
MHLNHFCGGVCYGCNTALKNAYVEKLCSDCRKNKKLFEKINKWYGKGLKW